MLEKKGAEERQKSVSIPINQRTIPELYEPTYLDEEKIIQKMLEQCDKDEVITLKYRDRWNGLPLYQRKASIVFNDGFEQKYRDILGLHINNDKEFWEEAVNSSNLSPELKSILYLSNPIKIANKSSREIIGRIEEYMLLDDDFRLVRQASAWMFWGASKVLDNRQDISEALGLHQAPIQINVHLSSSEKLKVLFIENSQTFEYAKHNASTFGEFTLVYLSGYMGTAKRTRTPAGSSLYFSKESSVETDTADKFTSWLYGQRKSEVYLWGDFDYEGIHIYLSLLKVFPETKLWTPAYSLMSKAAKSQGHSAHEAKKGNQIRPKDTGDTYIDDIILYTMDEFGFFDQEGIIF